MMIKIQSEERTPMACLVANLLLFPGMGSILGRKKVGYLQVTATILGFVLANFWLFTSTWRVASEGSFEHWKGSHFTLGIVGLLLMGMAWVWSLWTSIQMFRQAKK